MKTILATLTLLCLLFSCSGTGKQSSGAESSTDVIAAINASIGRDLGEFTVVDSARIDRGDGQMYFSWIVRGNKKENYLLYIFGKRDTLEKIAANPYIVEELGTAFQDDDYAYLINNRNDKGFVVTSENSYLTFTADHRGAYLDSILFFRRFIDDSDQQYVDSACLSRKDFGQLPISDFPDDFMLRHKLTFSPATQKIQRGIDEDVLKHSMLDDHSLNNLKNEASLKNVEWFDIDELFRVTPLGDNNLPVYREVARLLMTYGKYNEARLILVRLSDQYPDRKGLGEEYEAAKKAFAEN